MFYSFSVVYLEALVKSLPGNHQNKSYNNFLFFLGTGIVNIPYDIN